MLMIMFILDDPGKLDAVLAAWEAAGVSGVTIVESSGIGKRRRRQQQQRLPLRFPFERLPETMEETHYTLFTIVADEAVAEAVAAAAEKVVGDLALPHTGVLAAWPLTVVKGVPERGRNQEQEP